MSNDGTIRYGEMHVRCLRCDHWRRTQQKRCTIRCGCICRNEGSRKPTPEELDGFDLMLGIAMSDADRIIVVED